MDYQFFSLTFTLPWVKRVRNHHLLAAICRASFRMPWNATSGTAAQVALWQHTMDRNTSSQPLPPCTRQVMNRFLGNYTTLISQVLKATLLLCCEQSQYSPDTEKPETTRPSPQVKAHPLKPSGHAVMLTQHSKANPLDQVQDPTKQPGRATPGPVWR